MNILKLIFITYQLFYMSFKYHGNYCGPGWSAGKYQESVVSDVVPIDVFDATCKCHDAEYANGGSKLLADTAFAVSNITAGVTEGDPLRFLAGAAVGVQAITRLFTHDEPHEVVVPATVPFMPVNQLRTYTVPV